jgi:hypothetical protein
MATCTRCGRTNEADAKFCGLCGHSLAETSVPVEAADAYTPEETTEERALNAQERLWLKGLGGKSTQVALLLGGGAAFFNVLFLVGGEAPQNPAVFFVVNLLCLSIGFTSLGSSRRLRTVAAHVLAGGTVTETAAVRAGEGVLSADGLRIERPAENRELVRLLAAGESRILYAGPFPELGKPAVVLLSVNGQRLPAPALCPCHPDTGGR